MTDYITTRYSNWRQHHIPRLSAGLANYRLFALAPILVLVLAGLFLEEDEVMGRLMAEVEEAVGNWVSAAVHEMAQGVRNRESSLVATVISVLTLLYAASRVFPQLRVALNAV